MTEEELLTQLRMSGKSPFQAYKEALGKLEVAKTCLEWYAHPDTFKSTEYAQKTVEAINNTGEQK
jgi:hypothetical protein